MEKKVSSTGMYETTSGKLDNQTKAALLEYLTESDEFHKLVCDITGTERKQVKVSPELEKLKEDYSHMCESYEHEKQQRNDLIRKWREETAQRLDAERERDNAQRHHKFIVDEIFSMLKEVECSSVRGIVDELKAERANGKLLAEDNELCRRENDKLKLSYNKACEELKVIEKNMDSVSDNYAKLAKSHEYLNECNQKQANTITKQMNELLELRTELIEQKELVKKHMDKSEKLQSKLDKASKRYGELIKLISDKSLK